MKPNKVYSIIFFTFLIGHQPCHGASFLVDLSGKVLSTGMRNGVAAIALIYIYHQLKIHFQTPLEKEMNDLRQFCQGGLTDVNAMFAAVKEETELLAKSHSETLAILKNSNTHASAEIKNRIDEEQKKTAELLTKIKEAKRIIPHKVPAKGCCC